MTADQGRAEADVKIRTTRQAWMQPIVFGGIWLVFAIGWVTIDRPFFRCLLAGSRLRFDCESCEAPDHGR